MDENFLLHKKRALRLLELMQEVKDMIDMRLVEMGHARALLSLEDALQVQAAREVARKLRPANPPGLRIQQRPDRNLGRAHRKRASGVNGSGR